MQKYRTDSEYHGMEPADDGEYVLYSDVVELITFAMKWIKGMQAYKSGDVELVIEDIEDFNKKEGLKVGTRIHKKRKTYFGTIDSRSSSGFNHWIVEWDNGNITREYGPDLTTL